VPVSVELGRFGHLRGQRRFFGGMLSEILLRNGGEEGIQNKDMFKVLRCQGALLRRSMHHAQFPEHHEEDSAYRHASTEIAYRRGYREIPKKG
jgi:hypothetical protein